MVAAVVSAWAHNDTLQCVLELNERVFEGSIGSEFVRNGICNELSLGYYSKNESGDLMSRITNDTSTIQQALGFALVILFSLLFPSQLSQSRWVEFSVRRETGLGVAQAAQH